MALVAAEQLLSGGVPVFLLGRGSHASVVHLQLDGHALAGETNERLVVPEFRSDAAGSYCCRAFNQAGSTESAAANVRAAPPRMRPRVVDTGLCHISLEWPEPAVDQPIGMYRVVAMEHDDDPRCVACICTRAGGG